MDIHMPVMDGITATAKIAGLAGEEGIPIVGLTANIMENERNALFKAGAVDILFKPLDEQQLIETITELVGIIPSDSPNKTVGILESVASKNTLKEEINRLLNNLEQAINNDQRGAGSEIIHEMQGLSGIFGTDDITTAINTLRSSLKTATDHSEITSLIEKIKTTISDL
jgi:CheY-like chemotaxis protein